MSDREVRYPLREIYAAAHAPAKQAPAAEPVQAKVEIVAVAASTEESDSLLSEDMVVGLVQQLGFSYQRAKTALQRFREGDVDQCHDILRTVLDPRKGDLVQVCKYAARATGWQTRQAKSHAKKVRKLQYALSRLPQALDQVFVALESTKEQGQH